MNSTPISVGDNCKILKVGGLCQMSGTEVCKMISNHYENIVPGTDPGFFLGGGVPLRNGAANW